MKNSRIKLPNLWVKGRQYLLTVLTFILLIVAQGFVPAPAEITPEAKKVIEQIAPYLTSSTNYRATFEFNQTKIPYPDNFLAKTSDWPITAKIGYLYTQTQDHASGEKLLALMIQTLSQEYPSLQMEPLKKYFREVKNIEETVKPEDINYGLPVPSDGETNSLKLSEPQVKNQLVRIPKEVKQLTIAITPYLEGAALGREPNIYRNILNLSDEETFNILSSIETAQERLSKALSIASKNEQQVKYFIGEISQIIHDNYESARGIPEIVEALSWRKNGSKQTFDWDAIKIGDNGTVSKGHDIYKLNSWIYEDSTLLGFEIIPDIDSSSLKIVMSREFFLRRTPPHFFNDLAQAISKVSKKEVFASVYKIERDFRAKLLSMYDASPMDPFAVLKIKANQEMFVEENIKKDSFQSADEIWKNFRKRFPFHFQAIGLASYQPKGSYCLIISEPPPHVMPESISQYTGPAVKLVLRSIN